MCHDKIPFRCRPSVCRHKRHSFRGGGQHKPKNDNKRQTLLSYHGEFQNESSVPPIFLGFLDVDGELPSSALLLLAAGTPVPPPAASATAFSTVPLTATAASLGFSPSSTASGCCLAPLFDALPLLLGLDAETVPGMFDAGVVAASAAVACGGDDACRAQ